MRKIDLWGLTHLYVVGGNGGNAAANAINKELESAGVTCSVIGVPKSIDNDILLVSAYLSEIATVVQRLVVLLTLPKQKPQIQPEGLCTDSFCPI